MKITITQDFESAAEAAAFLARVTAPVSSEQQAAIPHYSPGNESAATPAAVTSGRKPRSDRGQKREPYGPRSTTTGEPASDGEGQKATTPAQASASPTTSAVVNDIPGTLDGCREAMKRLNAVPGKGMEANIAALKHFGVLRVSDLKPEQHFDFIKHVMAQVQAQ